MKGLTVNHRPTYLLATLALLGTATACGTNGKAITSGDVITAGNGACAVAEHQVKQGKGIFKVENHGSSTTDVAILTENDNGHFTKSVGHASGVKPGGTAEITTPLPQGQYRVVCSPNGGTSASSYVRAVTIEEGSRTGGRAYDKDYAFQVTPAGSVSTEPNLSVAAGDDVKLEVFNHSGNEYRLVVRGPSGEQAAALIAPARGLGQTNAELDEPGRYQVMVYASGQQGQATSYPLTVSK